MSNGDGRPSDKYNLLSRGLVLVGLLFFWGLAVHTSLTQTLTVDEPVHILRGHTLWQTGVMALQFEHGPFSHWLIGSLLFTEPTLADVVNLPSWSTFDRIELAQELLWRHVPPPNIERIAFLSRLPIIFVGMFAGAVIARWARQRSGNKGQAIALTLFAFSPNLLAHFSLATTDGALTAVYLISIFTLVQYWKRPSPQRWLWAAIALGAALATKLTALSLLPITLILCYSQRQRRDTWRHVFLIWLTIILSAFFILWTLYGFELRSLPNIPFPLPAATYVNSIIELLTHVQGGHEAYLLGERAHAGWWYYFIVAYFIKTPLPTLLLLVTAVAFNIKQRQWRSALPLLLPIAVLFVLASYSRFNIGYRHILPIAPFTLLLAADSPGRLDMLSASLKSVGAWALWLLLAWYVMGGLRQHPNHIAYFNELVGGSEQGYRFLGDSNLDWGQGLKRLADYAQETEAENFYFSYFGTADPAYYDLPPSSLFDAHTGAPLTLARANPAPGAYAISASHWQGLGLVDPHTFDWFRHQEPDGHLGYSMLIYDVPEAAPGTWIAHCTDPAALLTQETAVQLVGHQTLRHVYFDCRSSWVFPNEGEPGWYILPLQDEWPITQPFPSFKANLHLVYTHVATSWDPTYAVWYWDGKSDLTTLANDSRASLPALFGSAVQLTGYRVVGTDWWTIWHAQSTLAEPVTIAAHLYGDDLTPIIGDKMGYTAEQWQPGDWFIQMHHFDVNGRTLETGLYNYLTGERLPSSQETPFIQLPAPD